MPFTLFDHSSLRVYRANVAVSSYPVGRLFPPGSTKPVAGTDADVLAIIDDCSIFGSLFGSLSRLPLLYRVRNPTFEPFAYHVFDDSSIQLCGDSVPHQFVMRDYANTTTFSPKPIKYDPADPSDALKWAGVFGFDRLPDRMRPAVIAEVTKLWGPGDWSDRCIVPFELYEDRWDLICGEWLEPFHQNKVFGCPNRDDKCLHSYATPFATLYTKEHDIFDGYHALLIFTFCSCCSTVGVSNQ